MRPGANSQGPYRVKKSAHSLNLKLDLGLAFCYSKKSSSTTIKQKMRSTSRCPLRDRGGYLAVEKQKKSALLYELWREATVFLCACEEDDETKSHAAASGEIRYGVGAIAAAVASALPRPKWGEPIGRLRSPATDVGSGTR
jgi:hypothetical protein